MLLSTIVIQKINVRNKVMKAYYSSEFDSIYKAIDACNENQDWNVINIYPTGWRQEVCMVYYITK